MKKIEERSMDFFYLLSVLHPISKLLWALNFYTNHSTYINSKKLVYKLTLSTKEVIIKNWNLLLPHLDLAINFSSKK